MTKKNDIVRIRSNASNTRSNSSATNPQRSSSAQRKKKTTEKTRFMSRPMIILIFGLIILLIPVVIFGLIMFQAQSGNSTPEIGERFRNDLDPAITDNDMESLQKAIAAIEGVEACDVNMTTAQLRINVDTKDDLTKDQIKELCTTIYNKVNELLPIETYFTSKDSMRMYDLSINCYNMLEDSESYIYYILTKNAMMEKPATQLVSEPINKELAESLREANKNAENTEENSSTEENGEGSSEGEGNGDS